MDNIEYFVSRQITEGSRKTMPAGKEVLVDAKHARTRPIFPLGRLAP
jgi:hypothetical protein